MQVAFNGGLRVFGVYADRSMNDTFLDYRFERRKGEIIYSKHVAELPSEVKNTLKSTEPLRQLGEAGGAFKSSEEFDIQNADTKGLSQMEKVSLSKGLSFSPDANFRPAIWR